MMKDDIFYLTKLCGLTGEEDEVSRGLSILLEPLVDEMKIDEMGNLIGIRRCADPYAERLLLTAHMDQVMIHLPPSITAISSWVISSFPNF